MTHEHHTFNTVTVPVGLGGKTTPYVADPAPTLLVDLASVEADIQSEGVRKAEGVREEADSEARAIIEAATAHANQMKAEHERRLAELDEREQGALELLGTAERDATEAQAALDRAHTQASEILAEATAAAEAHLAEAQTQVDSLLAEAQTQVDSLLADAQYQAATRADALLADARDQADSLLADAHHQATAREEALLADARDQVDSLLAGAQHQAEAILAEARERAAEAATRTEDIQSVHLIEIQMLREREIELLDRVARLEAARAENSQDHQEFADATIEVDLDQELADLSFESSGRHLETGTEAPSPSSSFRLASYTPLTEQLSITAFRAPLDDKERRGRKRR